MQLQVETETAKELLRLGIQILGIPVQAMHFFLLTVTWEPITVTYIIRKSCGHTWPENTVNLSAFPWRAFSERALGTLDFPSFWLLGFSMGRLSKPSSPGVKCGWMVKNSRCLLLFILILAICRTLTSWGWGGGGNWLLQSLCWRRGEETCHLGFHQGFQGGAGLDRIPIPQARLLFVVALGTFPICFHLWVFILFCKLVCHTRSGTPSIYNTHSAPPAGHRTQEALDECWVGDWSQSAQLEAVTREPHLHLVLLMPQVWRPSKCQHHPRGIT